MLGWIVVLIVLAAISGLLGFGGFAYGAGAMAQGLFAVFLLLIVISVIFAALRRR